MHAWIALFRGINVGGKNILPMADLRGDLKSLGLTQIKTYIQSGNAVFQTTEESSAVLETEIATLIEDRHGFRPQVLVLDADQLEEAITSNPFPEAAAEPKTLHALFLAATPAAPKMDSLSEAQSPSERYHLTERVFYLHAPEGIGRSKLAAKAERFLGVPATGRNWRTVLKLREMGETAS